MAHIESLVTETDTASDSRIAIIDIGSNSVRMVVFERLARAPRLVFDEKVSCSLGQGLAQFGRLHPEGRTRALHTIRRFSSLIGAMRATLLGAVATAAVRDASDGEEFVKVILAETGIAVQILSGAEEARIAGLGVQSAFPRGNGVMGDLGGGSLELVRLSDRSQTELATLPLGPLRFQGSDLDSKSITGEIDAALHDTEWLQTVRGETLYAVGGAWRALARIHMAQNEYPLKMIHGYRVPRFEMINFAAMIAGLSSRSIAEIPGVPKKRVASMPGAARVLERLMRMAEPEDVVFCAYGLREGLVFDALPMEWRDGDPFLAAARDSAEREGRYSINADEITKWAQPLFDDEHAEHARLRYAACLLSNISWRGHPDYKAEMGMVRILHAPFVGIDHPGRAFVSLAVGSRYGGSTGSSIANDAQKLMSEDAAEEARAFGYAINLAHTLSGGMPNVISETKLRERDGAIELVLPKRHATLVGEAVEASLKDLGKSLGKMTSLLIE